MHSNLSSFKVTTKLPVFVEYLKNLVLLLVQCFLPLKTQKKLQDSSPQKNKQSKLVKFKYRYEN